MEDFTTDERQVVELRLAVENQLRARVLEAIQVTLEEELEAALGCKRYERSCSRSGYRNGRETRRITTEMGSMELDIPRGRISVEDGSTKEFQSRLLPLSTTPLNLMPKSPSHTPIKPPSQPLQQTSPSHPHIRSSQNHSFYTPSPN
jgi:hypothetical protein